MLEAMPHRQQYASAPICVYLLIYLLSTRVPTFVSANAFPNIEPPLLPLLLLLLLPLPPLSSLHAVLLEAPWLGDLGRYRPARLQGVLNDDPRAVQEQTDPPAHRRGNRRGALAPASGDATAAAGAADSIRTRSTRSTRSSSCLGF